MKPFRRKGTELVGRLEAAEVGILGLLVDQLEQLHGVRTTLDNHALVREVDVLVVSVKPQVVVKVLGAISGDIRGDQVIVSVAAGVPLSILEAVLPEGAHVVRTMPNTPAIPKPARVIQSVWKEWKRSWLQ